MMKEHPLWRCYRKYLHFENCNDERASIMALLPEMEMTMNSFIHSYFYSTIKHEILQISNKQFSMQFGPA